MATENTESTDIKLAGAVMRFAIPVILRGKVRSGTGSQSVPSVAEPVKGSAASAPKFPCFACLPWLFPGLVNACLTDTSDEV